jgi:hypothetical protein
LILKSFGFQQFFAARPKNKKEITGRIDIDSLIKWVIALAAGLSDTGKPICTNFLKALEIGSRIL